MDLERLIFGAMNGAILSTGSCRECLLVWEEKLEQQQHTHLPFPRPSCWLRAILCV